VARLRISYNAPVVLTFALIAAIVTMLPVATRTAWFAAKPDMAMTGAYLGFITHIFGHANWEHLLGNFMLILLVGPILEERYGSLTLIFMITITALVTGLVNLLIGHQVLMGASGIVFMMILLASTANIKRGEIPLTFIAIAILYLGGEIKRAFGDDNISQMAHLVGGAVGAVFGFVYAGEKAQPKLGDPKPKATLPA
jgi:membrane associated rhomboid family serine protease